MCAEQSKSEIIWDLSQEQICRDEKMMMYPQPPRLVRCVMLCDVIIHCTILYPGDQFYTQQGMPVVPSQCASGDAHSSAAMNISNIFDQQKTTTPKQTGSLYCQMPITTVYISSFIAYDVLWCDSILSNLPRLDQIHVRSYEVVLQYSSSTVCPICPTCPCCLVALLPRSFQALHPACSFGSSFRCLKARSAQSWPEN